MTETEINDVLRLMCRRYGRAFLIINSVLTVVGLIAVIVFDHVGGGVVVTALGVVLAWRATRMSVVIRADRMVVSSWVRVSTIELSQVRRFAVGSDSYLGASPSGLFDTPRYVRDNGRSSTVPAVVCLRLGLRGSRGMYPLVFELNRLLTARRTSRPV